ncbi:MAG: hypothetical protein KDA78_14930, partial [Planctomycetaceae bacterium]|nr:hypothetical protein [Planctomycetaceae bacterium]
DGALLRFLSSHFEIELTRSMNKADALQRVAGETYDLILINRKLDADYTDGVDVITALRETPHAQETPIMLISNYPDAQQRAVEAGALPGFGKMEFNKPEVVERLTAVLN